MRDDGHMKDKFAVDSVVLGIIMNIIVVLLK